jgi:hypothetical protein
MHLAYDYEPDWVEIAEKFLAANTDVHNVPRTGILEMLRKAAYSAQGKPPYEPSPTRLETALDIIEGLVEYIEENV